jgi:hypothetical protein
MQATTTNNSATNLNLLHDYLRANVSNFHRTTAHADGTPVADEDCGRVSKLGGSITVLFADDLDSTVVQQAIRDYEEM